jgi:hypothetical protein
VSPPRLKCINRSGFTVSIADTGFNSRMVTPLRDLSANLSQARTAPRECDLAERLATRWY